jgi:guanylate kinase
VSASRTGILFVVAAPSGTGKTTVCRRVVDADPLVDFSVSHTTRPPRADEHDGVDYYFVLPERFEELVREDAFLEWAEYNRERYGTSWREVETPLARGHDVLLEIEIQGASQVRQRRPDAQLVFLLPPSMEVLEQRLCARGTDSADEIERRLAVARGELEAAPQFDYAVVNGDLDRCVADVVSIFAGARAGRAAALRRRFDPRRTLAGAA